MARVLAGALTALLVAWPSAATAQQLIDDPESNRVKGSVLLVPGVHFLKAVFGDDTPKGRSTLGVSLGARFCLAKEGLPAFVTDGTLFPFPIRNPHFDEKLRPFHLDAGLRFGRGTYFRFGLGISFHFWSGKSASDKVSPALTATIAVGHEGTTGRTGVAPEIVARASVAPGVGVLSLGAQAAIGTCGR